MRKLLLPLFLIVCCSSFGQKKNIILIAVDDLNDWIGAFGGHPQAVTPNIDKLANKGVTFTNASCPSPVCNPSRTAIMSGRRPHETGVTNNGAGYFREGDQPNWVKNLISMPQYFGNKGYETVAQGKIFHTHSQSKGEFQKLGPGGQGCSAGPVKEKVPNTKIEWSKSNQTLTQTGDYKSAKWCGDYLKQNHNKPFFLACGIFRPHLPWFAPKEFYNIVPKVEDIILPPYLKNDRSDTHGSSNKVLDEVLKQGGERRWKETVQAYLANVAFADACVGKLLDDLESSQFKNNTVVVLIGDHGWHLGEKDHYQKFTMWDRAIKTPMIIYDPVDGGSGVCTKAVSLMDIMPTLLDLTNTPSPNFEIDGRSIGTLVKNPKANWCGVALTSYGNVDHSIRTDRYRYIKYKSGKEELYDHQTDPNEWTNVATKNSYSSVLEEHRLILNKMLNNEENPINNCSNNSCVADTDNDGTKDCDDACPTDPNKTEPGQCGCGNEETSNCGEVTIANITDLMTAENKCNTVTLSWTDVAGEDGYRVRKKAAGETVFTNLTDLPTGSTSYTDPSVLENTSYEYMVRPLKSGTAVAVSNIVPLTTPTCPIEGPENINDLITESNGCEVLLTWSDVTGEDGYRIRRKIEGEAIFTNIIDIAAGSTSYVDDQSDAFTSYVYVVRPLVNNVAVANSNQSAIDLGPCLITGTHDDDIGNSISVYPNPVLDILTISGTWSDWKLTDISGQILLTGNNSTIDIQGIPSGLFYLIIDNQTLKILKR